MTDKLIRKAIAVNGGHLCDVDALTVKGFLGYAAEHEMVTMEELERWSVYLAYINTADEVADCFAENTMQIMTEFIADARKLEGGLTRRVEDESAIDT